MEICCCCSQEVIKDLACLFYCKHWICSSCCEQKFKTGLECCPACQKVEDYEEDDERMVMKEMPECMNLDSDIPFERLSSECREKIMKISGFDFDEVRRSAYDELIDGIS